jgi:lysozyme
MLCEQDCASRETALSDLIAVPLTQHQFDALFSLAFNIGLEHFANSTLLKLLNAGDYVGASHQFSSWKYAGGAPVLLPRRLREVALFQTPG